MDRTILSLLSGVCLVYLPATDNQHQEWINLRTIIKIVIVSSEPLTIRAFWHDYGPSEYKGIQAIAIINALERYAPMTVISE